MMLLKNGAFHLKPSRYLTIYSQCCRCRVPHPPVQIASKSLRNNSTSALPVEVARRTTNGFRKLVIRTSVVATLLAGYLYFTDTRAGVHRYIVVPLLRWMFPDAEDAHHVGVSALRSLFRWGLHPRERDSPDDDGNLSTEVFGYKITNPIGISGGLDKHAEIPDALFALGPAIVEVGGTTPLPQEGNPRPRVFRLPSQSALINRYGLNSKGADHMAAILKQRVREYAYSRGFGLGDAAEEKVLNGEAGVPPGSLKAGKLLAVQMAKNKDTPDADLAAVTRDYVYCVERLAKYADILVVNVSSPNTPGLRDLQAAAPLTAILNGVVGAAQATDRKIRPFVMVKVSPDEDSREQIAGICQAIWDSGVDGVIVGNTTKSRPDPVPRGYQISSVEQETLQEAGGYSGPQLFDKIPKLVSQYRTLLDQGSTSQNYDPSSPRKLIFASGGISNGSQAQEALDAGAAVAMMYTATVYGGVGTITRVKQELKDSKRI